MFRTIFGTKFVILVPIDYCIIYISGNMAGKLKGAATRINTMYKLAIYVHCQAHRLNLCVVDSCKIQLIQNTLNALREITRFFSYPKRLLVLEKNIKVHY